MVSPHLRGEISKATERDPRFWGPGLRAAAVSIQSLEVQRGEEPIYSAPSRDSARRGSAALGARLPLFGAQLGSGCGGRWFSIGPDAFVCEDGVTLSPEAPLGLAPSRERSVDGLPYRYYFVNRDGSFGYDALSTAEDGVPNAQLQPGFGVAVQRIAEKSSGDAFGLTARGFWLPMRDLSPVAPTHFAGSRWSANLAWVIRDGAPLFSAPGKRKPGATLERLTTVAIVETSSNGTPRYVRIGDAAWLRTEDVRTPSLASAPAELRPNERWLDVDLTRQVLTAYQGETPLFATLVSSGRGAKGSETATPPGLHRIWVKLRTSDMDNIEDSAARENYAIEAVPWVMFFERGYGLHGTFWHRRFGEVKSHGCVNLSPRDGEQLFNWTAPRLFPGWTAVLPTPREPGTLIRVRAD
ncbi:MAG TPA: L,D-transpeptidase [Polyangiaceae bacterium]|nr:L,D-transpeptidase [Polyangiaceae bacterium]